MKKETIFIAIGVFAVIATIIIWRQFIKSKPAEFVVEVREQGELSEIDIAAGKEFTDLLKTIEKIKIDAAFFEDPLYRALVDFTPLIVPPAEKGRANPFMADFSAEEKKK